ncbi:DUF5655 domain-containing protein [Micromonospora sp. DT81.3]|uniref:DUF5655 domain-containing protein n=1 Tax=Micromonospora sp. DT81.3 TaxID=3416523 RepID=UPI003CF7431C
MSRDPSSAPMWRCPFCGRTFAARNQAHTCAPLGDLDRHFLSSGPSVRATFERIIVVLTEIGPFTVLPEKTRIAFQVRMSFAAVTPRRSWLNGHLVLDGRVESSRFTRIETYSRRNVLHAFRLVSPDEVDGEFAVWLAAAYRVGEQGHRAPRIG